MSGEAEPEVETVVTSNSSKEGFLKIKGKGSWKYRYFILVEGTLFQYRDQLDLKPVTSHSLKDGKIDTTDIPKHKNSFTLTVKPSTTSSSSGSSSTTTTTEIQASSKTTEDKNEWVKSLKEAFEKAEALGVPHREKVKKKSLLFSASKNVSEAVVTSSIGKKIITEFASEEAITLLRLLKTSITTIYDREKAATLEKYIYKLSVKTALLFNAGKINDQDLLPLRPLILRAWSCVVDYCEMAWSVDVPYLTGLLNNIHDEIHRILKGHVTPSTLNKLRWTFNVLSNSETLEKFFGSSNQEVQTKVMTILRGLWDSKLSDQDRLVGQNDVSKLPATANYTDPGSFQP